MKSRTFRGLLLALCGLLFVANVCAEAITISRDLPENAGCGSKINVNLNMNVVSTETAGVIITECVPEGWNVSYASNDGYFNPDTGEIKWVLYGGNIITQTISYKITVPQDASGTCTFNGTYATLEGGALNIAGKESINVAGAKHVTGGETWTMFIILGAVALILVVLFVLLKRK